MNHAPPIRINRVALGSLTHDRERVALWMPVAFGAGIITYFELPEEPHVLWPAGIGLVGIVVLLSARWFPSAILWAITILLFATGWGWSQWRTWTVERPVLADETRALSIAGRIVDLEPRGGSTTRAVLDELRIEGFEPDATPERIRVTFRATDRPPAPGQTLQGRAVLRPPPPPVAPGGYDFQRQAYFEQIGGVGFLLGTATVAGDDTGSGWSIEILLEHLRRRVEARISAALSGPDAALANALVVGERGQIADADRNALRDAGLAHLLAISGLHIGIVAGFLFWSIRAVLALWPTIALRYPIKKWAAMTALVCALIYMLIAGATPPTQRAFLMVAIALLAIMIDRNPISMRLVGVAAFAILLLSPSIVLGPSFQLSFAAVIALIAAFEWIEARRVLLDSRPGRARSRPLVYLGAVTYSTLIATISTAPFALFHFQQVALYGVVANLVAIPLMAFWVMPCLAIGCIAALAGFGEIGFVPAGWGIAVLRTLAHEIADWPGAVFRAPLADSWTMGLIAAGGLWLCLWRSHVRWAGLGPVLAGMIAMMLFSRPPDAFVSGYGDPFAFVDEGRLAVPSLRRDQFTTENWARLSGLDPGEDRALLPAGTDDAAAIRCDAAGCTLRREGHRLAFAESFDALDADCRLSALVVTLFPGGPECPTGVPTIRYLDLFIDGAHAIWIGNEGEIEVESVGAARGYRPWVTTNR